MGNSESYNSQELVMLIAENSDYRILKRRALKLGVNITIQGDASIQIQDTKDLVRGNFIIPAPKTHYDISDILKKLESKLDDLATNRGYTHFGYQ